MWTVLKILPLVAGLGVIAIMPAESEPGRASSAKDSSIIDTVNRLAPFYGLDPALVRAIIETESAYNTAAISQKNAIGVMQLLPETAARFGITDPFDPVQNLHGGMRYLRWLLDYFHGNLALALAGYNAGENAVTQYGGVPPFTETKTYVASVLRRYGIMVKLNKTPPKAKVQLAQENDTIRNVAPVPFTSPISEQSSADGCKTVFYNNVFIVTCKRTTVMPLEVAQRADVAQLAAWHRAPDDW